MQNYIPIIVAIITSGLTGAFSIYLFQKKKIENIENQLSQKKFEVYSQFIFLIYDMQKSFKTGDKLSEEYKRDEIYKIKANLLIYGSDSVVKSFFEWEKQSLRELSTSTDATSIFYFVSKVFEEIRSDMMSFKTKIDANVINDNFNGYRN